MTTSAYSRRKASYAPFASEFVAGYQKNDNFDGRNKGETSYSDTKIGDYSDTGCGEMYRHRRGLKIRGCAAYVRSNCSSRSIFTSKASYTWYDSGCITQVLLTD